MFDYFKNKRRNKLKEKPFPPQWTLWASANVKHWCLLSQDERRRLEDLIKVFLADKNWEAAGGLELTEEIKLTISALACLLILELDHDFYRNVDSIIVYPSTVILPQRQLGFFEIPKEPIVANQHILGQAIHNGPVVIAWDAALFGSLHPEHGHNVVFHEFAHKLDMLDGFADGTPPLRSGAEYKEWMAICSAEYLRLRHFSETGHPSFLQDYAATNEAEFFAVATEQFFNEPLAFDAHAPALYQVLKNFYKQDPAARLKLNLCNIGY